jgi:2-dehydro-3-deoxygluconokinase
MTTPVEVFTAGEAMALMLADAQQPLPVADRFIRSVAGSESNVAVGLARLGHRVAYCGRVGADAPGGWVRAALGAEGVDLRGLAIDPERPTGMLLRDGPVARPVTVAYYRRDSAGSALGPDDLPPELVAGAKYVFVSGITPMLSTTCARFTERLLDVAAENRVPVAFDPNVRLRVAPPSAWRARIGPLLDRVDTLLIGRDELAILGLEGKGPSDLLTERRRTVVIKCGAEGAVAATAEETVQVAARPVRVIDPVGAGDAFCAGWMSAVLRGKTLGEAVREAAVVAALVVACSTDTAGLPSAELRDRLLQESGSDVDR